MVISGLSSWNKQEASLLQLSINRILSRAYTKSVPQIQQASLVSTHKIANLKKNVHVSWILWHDGLLSLLCTQVSCDSGLPITSVHSRVEEEVRPHQMLDNNMCSFFRWLRTSIRLCLKYHQIQVSVSNGHRTSSPDAPHGFLVAQLVALCVQDVFTFSTSIPAAQLVPPQCPVCRGTKESGDWKKDLGRDWAIWIPRNLFCLTKSWPRVLPTPLSPLFSKQYLKFCKCVCDSHQWAWQLGSGWRLPL